MKARPPLLGNNTNIKYNGIIYHVQTEDVGVEKAYFITHLFKNGVILSTKKYQYSDLLEKPDRDQIVRELMQKQHKNMCQELIDGKFDLIIKNFYEKVDGQDKENKNINNANLQSLDSVMRTNHKTGEIARTVQLAVKEAKETKKAKEEVKLQTEQPDNKVEAKKEDEIILKKKKVSLFSNIPAEKQQTKTSGSNVDEKSLDEVILEYLSQSLKDNNE